MVPPAAGPAGHCGAFLLWWLISCHSPTAPLLLKSSLKAFRWCWWVLVLGRGCSCTGLHLGSGAEWLKLPVCSFASKLWVKEPLSCNSTSINTDCPCRRVGARVGSAMGRAGCWGWACSLLQCEDGLDWGSDLRSNTSILKYLRGKYNFDDISAQSPFPCQNLSHCALIW